MDNGVTFSDLEYSMTITSASLKTHLSPQKESSSLLEVPHHLSTLSPGNSSPVSLPLESPLLDTKETLAQ